MPFTVFIICVTFWESVYGETFGYLQERYVNSTCHMNNLEKTPGICVNIKKCAHAVSNLVVGIEPTICKLENDPMSVCCPTVPRISEHKCREYVESVRGRKKGRKRSLRATIASDLEQKLTGLKPYFENVTCPLMNPFTNRISGGSGVERDQYPHQVALGYGSEGNVAWRCGGTLISEYFVLTAGHCVQTKFGLPVKVLLGDRFLSKAENPARIILGVIETFVHPKYKPPQLYNDIALIKLSDAVTLFQSILPVCLPQPEYRLDKKTHIFVTGWGQLGALENTSDLLQYVEIDKFITKECSTEFMKDANNKISLPQGIIPGQFCAGDKKGNKDACHGDSGSPAVVTLDSPCVFYVVGITSFGSSFCGYQQPGVYTNVQRYLDWVEEIVWPSNTRTKEKGTFIQPHDQRSEDSLSKTTTPKYLTTLSTTSTFSASTSTTITTSYYKSPTTKRVKETTRHIFLADNFVPTKATTSPHDTSTINSTSTPSSTERSSVSTTQVTTLTSSSTGTTSHPPIITTGKKNTSTSVHVVTPVPLAKSNTSTLISQMLKYSKNITISGTVDNVTASSEVKHIMSLVNNI